MKKDIKFECDVYGQKQVVEVSILHGGGTLQTMIDRFFIKDVDFRNGEWVMLCCNTSWLTTDGRTCYCVLTVWKSTRSTSIKAQNPQ